MTRSRDQGMQDTTIVTGGSGGIGAAIVERLEAEGQRVVILDRVPPAPGPGRLFERLDLADAEATSATLARLCGSLAVTRLVNNAAISSAKPGEEETPEGMRRMIAVNLLAPLLCTRAVLPAMIARGFGRIVNIGSRGSFGKEARFAYNATKGGIHTVTRSWALEFAPHGITVNAVAPGVTETPLYRRNNPPGSEQTQRVARAIPMGRIAQPGDVAEAVAFFLSARAGYITGQVLMVCGGLSLGTRPAA